ncbi:MAG: hypothetical protein ABW168_10510, partial [Sedimenticola sp.]
MKTRVMTCYDCGGKDHMAKMCNSKTKKVHVIQSEENDCVADEVFTLTGKNDAIITLILEGVPIDILVDIGASVNAIDRCTYEKIKTTQNFLSKTNAKIYPYGSNVPLKLHGKTNLNVQVGEIVHNVEFQVITGTGKPLIGRKSATDIGLLHIGVIN